MAETYSAGVVTAYGAAVRGGYTGTYEEFCAEQAKFAENAAAVAQAKEDVETMQGQVEQAAATFTGTTVPAAVTTVQEAGAAQVQAVQDEGTMQAAAVETVGAQQKAAVKAAGSDAVDAVETAETAATDTVTAAQTAAVQAVQAESTTQQAAIQTKGEQTIASIPADYTALTEEVNDVKSALNFARDGQDSFFLHGVFAVGGLTSSGVFDPTRTNRVSSASQQDTIVFDRDITVNCADGFRWGFVPITDETPGTWSGWKFAPYTIPANTHFVLQIRRDPEVADTANVREFLSALSFALADTESVKALKTQVNAIPIAVPSAVGKFFEKGSIGGDGSDSTYRINSRARSSMLFFPNPAQLSIVNTATYPDAKMGIHYYDPNGAHLSDSGWVVDAYIPGGSFCRILISPLPTAGTAVTYTLEEILSCLSSSPVLKPAYNRTVKIASHQGNMYGADTNHCKLAGYIAAGKAGFDYVEGDVKFTSDSVPVLSHDNTFTDATSGETVTISQTTLADLLTHNYFGGTIATLEEVVLVCKQYGMGIILDQMIESWGVARYDTIFTVLNRHRFVANTKFVCYGETSATRILARCRTASIIAGQPANSQDASAAIALANSIVTDYNHVDVALNNILGEAVIAEAAATMDERFGLMTYHNDTVAAKQTFGKYATVLFSNVNAALFND